MPSNRNPLTEGKRAVTMRMAGPTLYAVGGTTWTFREARNIRRIISIEDDVPAALGGGDPWYVPMVVANDGQGNTRTVQIFTFALGGVWAEVGAVDLSTRNFIVKAELAEGV